MPTTAISAMFLADDFAFTDPISGLDLDAESVDNLLSHFGNPDVDTLLDLVICTVGAKDGTLFKFSSSNEEVFDFGLPIKVDSY